MRRAVPIIVALIVLLIVIVGGVEWVGSDLGDSMLRDDKTDAAGAAAPAREKPRRDAAAKPDADVATSAAIPAPVDLATVDRDRDLHGVVVRRDGSPVVGAEVVAVAYPWRRSGALNPGTSDLGVDGPRTHTATDGTFALRLRRGTRAGLRVRKDGLPETRVGERMAGERVRIVVDTGVRLRLAVVDETNRVVAGARFSLYSSSIGRREIETDADGQAAADGLPSSSRFDLELLSPGWGDLGCKEVGTGTDAETTEALVLTKGRTLHGRVVDAATGTPIENARIGMNWTLQHAVATDAAGRYELTGWSGHGIEDIHVLADGYVRESAVVGAGEEFDFRLRRGFEASGRVVDGDGRPVKDAIVALVASTHDSDRRQRISSGDATSGADGRFRIGGLDPQMTHVLVVTADGFGRARKAAPLPNGAATLDLGDVGLASGRLLAGRFLDADGKPMPRAWIVIDGPRASLGSGLDGNDYGADEDAHTDDLGRFAFADLAPGAYTVHTECDGSLQCSVDATLPGERDLTDVVLRSAASSAVEVHVVDAKGEPVAGFWIVASSDEGEPVDGQTDAHGVASLRLPSDRCWIDASPPSEGTKRYIGCEPKEWTKGTAVVTFVALNGAAIQGVVVDPQGKGVPQAVVRVEEGDGTKAWETTDDSGRFDWTFEPGAKARLVFEGTSAGKESGLSGAVDCSAPQTGVVLNCASIETDRKLAVKATTPDGTPVVGATVEVSGHEWTEPRTATTDATGVARFDALPARTLTVVVRATDAWARSAAAEATPSGQEIAVALRRGVAVRGVVVGADGKPAKAGVTVWRGEEEAGRVRTDAEGRFALLVPADVDAPIRVSAQGPDGRGHAEEATPETEMRIVLAK
jgi:hypothetical protein